MAGSTDWRSEAAAMRPLGLDREDDGHHEQHEDLADPNYLADGYGAAGGVQEFEDASPHEAFEGFDAPVDRTRDSRSDHSRDRYDHDAYSDRGGYADYSRDALGGAPYYDEGAPMAPYDEDMYDDPPRSRARNGLITAVTLIGCAVLGTAAAYGYRTYYTGASSSRTPPIITAETTPTKVVATVDPQVGGAFQDRDQGQGERLVSREEQPIDPTPSGSSTPRIVLPMPITPSQSGTPATLPPRTAAQGAVVPPAAASAGSANGEPKKIRTVAIRPDGSDGSSRPVTPSSTQSATARPPAAAKAPSRGSGPLSLDPQASVPPAPAARERTRVAAPVTPAEPELASASASAAGGSGGYVVQLSSQRSEAEAQASFRALQAKFPDQLSGRTPIIQRANLHDKGTYYRATVGPFASSEEASRFCGSYKAAGGQCIIQKN
jgi:hypothetical protein